MSDTWNTNALTPEEGLQRLIDGNKRFREGTARAPARSWSPQLDIVAQRPFAIVLGCSDSRMPVEILFDEGFGDLFVVRVAGNVVAPSVLGSIEFAASQFGSRLVVVMGHTRCGAVGATVNAIQTGLGPESKSIRSITDRIGPHVEALVRRSGDDPGLLREAVRTNVRASAKQVRAGTPILQDLVGTGQVAVIGAEYELETGTVHFFDWGPRAASPLREVEPSAPL